jgi:hypothetical protein
MRDHSAILALHNEASAFFEALGRCIAEWAFVDEQLFLIFRDCIGLHEQSAIIYYRTPGLDLRLTLTNEIVISVLPHQESKDGGHDHETVKAWREITKNFRDLLPVRRRLAHHPVDWKGDELIGSHGLGISLQVHVGKHEIFRENSSVLSPLTIADLRKHLSSVKRLGNFLNDYSRDVLTPLRERIASDKESANPHDIKGS